MRQMNVVEYKIDGTNQPQKQDENLVVCLVDGPHGTVRALIFPCQVMCARPTGLSVKCRSEYLTLFTNAATATRSSSSIIKATYNVQSCIAHCRAPVPQHPPIATINKQHAVTWGWQIYGHSLVSTLLSGRFSTARVDRSPVRLIHLQIFFLFLFHGKYIIKNCSKIFNTKLI